MINNLMKQATPVLKGFMKPKDQWICFENMTEKMKQTRGSQPVRIITMLYT